MERSYESYSGNGSLDNGHLPHTKPSSLTPSLPWLELKVFYFRVSKCEIDDNTPESLTLNHVPLDPDTLFEVNGVRTSLYSDGETTVLRRDRLDKKSEEVTFVSTDSIRTTGSVKFEVFDKEVLLLSGVLELNSNGDGLSKGSRWIMECESSALACTGFIKGKQSMGGSDSGSSPIVEVFVTGLFCGTPIILTKTLHLRLRKKHSRKALLDSIPECDSSELEWRESPPPTMDLQETGYDHDKLDLNEYGSYREMGYMEGEDGELTWFNAGVRVGVGIGLSVCLGIGLGVGLLVKTYQGTTRSFRRRLL